MPVTSASDFLTCLCARWLAGAPPDHQAVDAGQWRPGNQCRQPVCGLQGIQVSGGSTQHKQQQQQHAEQRHCSKPAVAMHASLWAIVCGLEVNNSRQQPGGCTVGHFRFCWVLVACYSGSGLQISFVRVCFCIGCVRHLLLHCSVQRSPAYLHCLHLLTALAASAPARSATYLPAWVGVSHVVGAGLCTGRQDVSAAL